MHNCLNEKARMVLLGECVIVHVTMGFGEGYVLVCVMHDGQ